MAYSNSFTPLIPSSAIEYCIETDTVAIGWELPEGQKPLLKEVMRDSHVVAESNHPFVLPTSMADCQHDSTGKMWRSIFIPLDRNGSTGVSITMWGKDYAVKGQTQVKSVSETEWYTVLKSKYEKGYKVVNYVGRRVPLKVGHEFVEEISADPNVNKLPVISSHDIDMKSLGSNMNIGMAVANAISKIPPMDNILREALRKGHTPLIDMINLVQPSPVTIRDFVDGFTSEYLGIYTDGPGSSVTPREKVPDINREEVYGNGWGAFC